MSVYSLVRSFCLFYCFIVLSFCPINLSFINLFVRRLFVHLFNHSFVFFYLSFLLSFLFKSYFLFIVLFRLKLIHCVFQPFISRSSLSIQSFICSFFFFLFLSFFLSFSHPFPLNRLCVLFLFMSFSFFLSLTPFNSISF